MTASQIGYLEYHGQTVKRLSNSTVLVSGSATMKVNGVVVVLDSLLTVAADGSGIVELAVNTGTLFPVFDPVSYNNLSHWLGY